LPDTFPIHVSGRIGAYQYQIRVGYDTSPFLGYRGFRVEEQ
jgi:hypothetical protein